MGFAYDTCIACDRKWSPEDHRQGKEWWPLRDQEIKRWCCYRCISRAWRRSAAASRPGYSCACPANVEEALQTAEFQLGIRYFLEKHRRDYATEPVHSSEPDHSPEHDHSTEPDGSTGPDHATEPDHNSDSMMDVD